MFLLLISCIMVKKKGNLMTDTSSDSSLKAMVVFGKANRTVEGQVTSIFKTYGVTPTQFSAMDVLYKKGEMKICQLIGSMLATSGNMTVVIKNMERNGWIYRKTDASDKRASVVGLTQSGRDLIEQIMPEHRANVQAVFSVLTAEEQEQLIHLLKKFKHLKP